MPWLPLLSYFFGGAFLANAIPHFVSGMMGRPFQSPVRQAAGGRALLVDRQRALGLFQHRRRLPARLPCRRFRRGGTRVTSPRLGCRRAAYRAFFRARWFGRFNGGNAPGASMKASVARASSGRCEVSTIGFGPAAPSSPMSAPGCSGRPRTGWCSPSSPITTRPPSAWSWRCSSGRSFCCCRGPASPPTISTSASC